MKKALLFCSALLIVSACQDQSSVATYNYNDLTVTSSYGRFAEDNASAQKKGQLEFKSNSRSVCRKEFGGGWSLSEIKNPGEMNCEEISDGHHCRIKDAQLSCKQVIDKGFGN
jgi:hypothetical protein